MKRWCDATWVNSFSFSHVMPARLRNCQPTKLRIHLTSLKSFCCTSKDSNLQDFLVQFPVSGNQQKLVVVGWWRVSVDVKTCNFPSEICNFKLPRLHDSSRFFSLRHFSLILRDNKNCCRIFRKYLFHRNSNYKVYGRIASVH